MQRANQAGLGWAGQGDLAMLERWARRGMPTNVIGTNWGRGYQLKARAWIRVSGFLGSRLVKRVCGLRLCLVFRLCGAAARGVPFQTAAPATMYQRVPLRQKPDGAASLREAALELVLQFLLPPLAADTTPAAQMTTASAASRPALRAAPMPASQCTCSFGPAGHGQRCGGRQF